MVNGRVAVEDNKFVLQPEEMVFDAEITFKDGIYGLYKRRGLDPGAGLLLPLRPVPAQRESERARRTSRRRVASGARKRARGRARTAGSVRAWVASPATFFCFCFDLR